MLVLNLDPPNANHNSADNTEDSIETDEISAETNDISTETDDISAVNNETAEIASETPNETPSETTNETIEELLELEEEEEIFTTIVKVHKRKKRTVKIAERKFDDFFEYQDHSEYSYENSGEFHDHDFREYPKPKRRRKPRKFVKKRRKFDPYKHHCP